MKSFECNEHEIWSNCRSFDSDSDSSSSSGSEAGETVGDITSHVPAKRRHEDEEEVELTETFVYSWGQEKGLKSSTIQTLYQKEFRDRDSVKLLTKKVIKQLHGLSLAEAEKLRESIKKLRIDDTYVTTWGRMNNITEQVLQVLIKSSIKDMQDLLTLKRSRIDELKLSRNEKHNLFWAVRKLQMIQTGMCVDKTHVLVLCLIDTS